MTVPASHSSPPSLAGGGVISGSGGSNVSNSQRPDEVNGGDGGSVPPGRRALSSTDLYRTAGLLFLLALVLVHFDPLSRVLLLAFLAAIVAVALNKLVGLLPLKRGLATAVTAIGVVGGIGVGFYFLGTAVAREIRALADEAPALLDTLRGWEEWLQEEIGLELELLGPRALEMVGQLPALLIQAVGLLAVRDRSVRGHTNVRLEVGLHRPIPSA